MGAFLDEALAGVTPGSDSPLKPWIVGGGIVALCGLFALLAQPPPHHSRAEVLGMTDEEYDDLLEDQQQPLRVR